MKHLSINITGNVQGVFFREGAKKRAEEFGLAGTVGNMGDGSVQIEVEGEDGAIDQFLAWCQKGPGGAEVRSVGVQEGEVQGMEGFEIVK